MSNFINTILNNTTGLTLEKLYNQPLTAIPLIVLVCGFCFSCYVIGNLLADIRHGKAKL